MRSGCGADAERSGSMERMRNGYGDKMRHLNEFFASFYISVFWIYVFFL